MTSTLSDKLERFLDELRTSHEGKKVMRGEVRLREPMSRHTTMKVGGTADVLVIPHDLDELRRVMISAARAGLPLMVLGGSNLIVSDHGVAGVVVKLSQLNRIRLEGDHRMVAEAGVVLPRLARAAARAGLSGLEFAVGIPGSVGGSVVMNAGTRDGELAPLIDVVTIMTVTGELLSIGRESLRYRYRRMELPRGCVVSAQFALRPAPVKEIEATMARMLNTRNATQPLNFPSAGCVFQNPAGDSAGRLIEAAGLKGYRIGDAQVSDRHANFIINRGHASAGEILSLIRHVGRQVETRCGVTLELEVKIIGRTVSPGTAAGVPTARWRKGSDRHP